MWDPNRCSKSEVLSEELLVILLTDKELMHHLMCVVVLMGKNTMIRKAIRGHLEKNPLLEKLLPHIKGNIGFVFTKQDLKEVRDKIQSNQVHRLMTCDGCVNIISRLLLQPRQAP